MTPEQSGKRRAQSLVEYALILSLLAVIVISVLIVLGSKTASAVGSAANSFDGEPTIPSVPYMYVSSISLSVRVTGPWTRVTGDVYVLDEDGGSLRGATVAAAFSVNGDVVDSQSESTTGSGRARFRYSSRDLASGDEVTLEVTGITLSGYEYDPDSNVESSDDVVIP